MQMPSRNDTQTLKAKGPEEYREQFCSDKLNLLSKINTGLIEDASC